MPNKKRDHAMRQFNRFKTDLKIACLFNGDEHTVGLYNLSCGGCMIEAASVAATEGMPIEINLNEKIKTIGHIAWRFERNVGVKFDIPLHPKVVEHFGYEDEAFDRNDPRDRFGMPLVEVRSRSAGNFD